MNYHRKTTRSDIVEKAEERTDPLNMLIDPSEVDESAETWEEISEDTLEREIAACFEHMPNRERDSRYSDLVHELTMDLVAESLIRAPLSDLAFESEREALKNGYWVYDMNVMDMKDMAYNDICCHEFDGRKIDHIYGESLQEATEAVDEGIAKGLEPDV